MRLWTRSGEELGSFYTFFNKAGEKVTDVS